MSSPESSRSETTWDTPSEKYDASTRREMAASGVAMPDGSYPVADAEDLHDAIRAVGRGRHDDHDAIRRHIVARADVLGMQSEIPSDWNADGSLAA